MNYYRNPRTGAMIVHDVDTGAIVELEPLGAHDPVVAKTAPTPPPIARNKKGGRPKGHNKTESEQMADAAPRAKHPETDKIQEMLLSGAKVPEILEKIDVSAPTVYVIRARLRKEGKL